MTYRPNDLSALAYANGFTGWHYRSPDRAEECLTPGYFDSAANMLRVGDKITLTCADNKQFLDAFVTYNREGRVEIIAAHGIVGVE